MLSGAELDIALIRTEKPLLMHGSSGLKLNTPLSGSSKAGVLGYGNKARLKASTGIATNDRIDKTVFYDGLRIQWGMSGGPVFTGKGDTQRGSRSLVSRSHADAQLNAALVIGHGERLPADNLERFVQASDVEPLRSLGRLGAFRSQKDILDSITGLPVSRQDAGDDIGSTGVAFSRGYVKAPIRGEDLTLLSANERQVSGVIADTSIFDTSGIHVFGNKRLESSAKGKAIVVVSDDTPGYQSFADLISLYKGSFGQDLVSSSSQEAIA